jgi:hypothetical protein
MCPKGIITVKVAEERLPFVARRIALEAIDLNILLEYYPVNTHVVERRIMSLMGYLNLLAKLSYKCWKTPKPKKKMTKQIS